MARLKTPPGDDTRLRMPLRGARPLLLRLQTEGVAVAELLAALGIDIADVFSPTGACDWDTYVQLWRRALEVSRDPALPLHAAEAADLRLVASMTQDTEYGAVQMLVQSDTLGQGLERLARFWSVYNPLSSLHLVRSAGEATLRIEFADAHHEPPGFAEYIITLLARGVQTTTARPVTVRAVHFRRDAPSVTAEYERLLGTAIRFGAPQDAFVLPEHDLTVPMSTPRPAVVEMLERRAEARAAAGGGLIDRVKAIVEADLASTVPTAERTAARLQISVRTLARRLGAEGTSHRQLVDQVRMELAAGHLAQEQLGVEQVALLLGFSDSSAFHRAFKRWSGVSPSEFRRTRLAER